VQDENLHTKKKEQGFIKTKGEAGERNTRKSRPKDGEREQQKQRNEGEERIKENGERAWVKSGGGGNGTLHGG